MSPAKRKAEDSFPIYAVISIKKKARRDKDTTSESGSNMEMQYLAQESINLAPTYFNLISNTLDLITHSKLYMLIEDNEFWMELKNTELQREQEFLQLEHTKFFSGHSILFIRNCYDDLVEVALNSTSNLRITGTPGIGKTFFSYYLLYQLARDQKTVIYHKFDEAPILFSKDQVFRCDNLSGLKGFLDKPDVWYIVVGQKPKICKARTILICSQEQHYIEFDRRANPDIRYMPAWSWKEIDACKKMIFEDLESTEVWSLFKMWGGIPQTILVNAHNKNYQDNLQEAIDTCGKEILKYVGENAYSDDINHKLVHIYTNLPDENDDSDENDDCYPYTQKIMKFASDYVSEAITKRLEAEMKNRLYKGLDLNNDNQFLNDCFKLVAHQMLRKGGKFEVRSLESNETYTLTINLSQENVMCKFYKIDKIENDKYYQPIRKENFPSFDAIIAPDSLFQMTTAKEHIISEIGLKKVHDKLLKDRDINFYFVVPANLYNNFEKQEFDTDFPQGWISKHIKQYVLKIDLSPNI